MKITIIGTGYVGLVTGACLAEFGHHIICMDKDAAKISSLLEGKIPIYEPGLTELVRKNMSEGRLSFTTELKGSVEKASAVFIAVGTPTSRRGDGYADLTYIHAAARELAPCLRDSEITNIPSCFPSSGHLCLCLNHKILDITQLCLRFCSIGTVKYNPNLVAIQVH